MTCMHTFESLVRFSMQNFPSSYGIASLPFTLTHGLLSMGKMLTFAGPQRVADQVTVLRTPFSATYGREFYVVWKNSALHWDFWKTSW